MSPATVPSALSEADIRHRYNSQSRLRERWNEPADLRGGSHLYFADSETAMGGGGGLSSGREGTSSTQFTTSDEYTHQYHRRSRRGHRTTPNSGPNSTPTHGDDDDADEEARRPLTRGSSRRSRHTRRDSRRNARDRDRDRYIFHEHEATLVQDSPLRAVSTPPTTRMSLPCGSSFLSFRTFYVEC